MLSIRYSVRIVTPSSSVSVGTPSQSSPIDFVTAGIVGGEAVP